MSETIPQIACAIYARTAAGGTAEASESLRGQREAAVAYIAEQHAEGWFALDRQYNDEGRSGLNADRPGLRRLVRDVEAGEVGAVVVERMDRLTRSMDELVRLIGVFKRKGVILAVAATRTHTATSEGRAVVDCLVDACIFMA